MCFVLELSRYVLVPILTEWFDLLAILSFDSAICSNRWRKNLKELVTAYHTSFQCLFEAFGSYPLSSNLIDWMNSRRIDFSIISKVSISNHYLGCLNVTPSYFNVRSASILGCAENNVPQLLNIIQSCDCLEEIVLNQCNYRISDIVNGLSQHCQSLRVLHLAGLEEAISSVLLIDLCRLNPCLIELVVQLRSVNRHFGYALAIYCRHLQVLNISSPIFPPSVVFMLLLHCAKNLRKFSCNHSLSGRQSQCLLWYHGSTLDTLDMSECSLPRGIQFHLGMICPRLTELNFSKYLEDIEDSFATTFHDRINLDNLISLNTEEFPIVDNQLCLIAKYSRLEKLSVTIGNLSAVGFKDLFCLREVSLEGDCDAVGEILNTIGITCHKLTVCSLLMHRNKCISNEFENFLKCTSDRLTSLFLNYFFAQERGLLAVARYCTRHLRVLKVRNFNGNCEGLKEAVRNCLRLHTLVLTPFVSSSLIDFLALHGNNLTDISICEARQHCDALKRLVRQLPRLTVLHGMLSKEIASALQSVNKDLVIESTQQYSI